MSALKPNDEEKIQFESNVKSVSYERIIEITEKAREDTKWCNSLHWNIYDQFRLMAYHDEITGAEHQALKIFYNLPGRLW